jgi:hypothetical protein
LINLRLDSLSLWVMVMCCHLKLENSWRFS